ncbi:MAG: DUF5674 family protein [Candidatus Margulisbacteria bacterium]|nr:DUF5674 family protein [Candidatus Margulisiibacteriota bacterium]
MNFKTADERNPLELNELSELLGDPYNSMIKFTIDVELEKAVFGGEMHADSELILLKNGSLQKNIWGANLYPERERSIWLEYTSLINIRPTQDNLSMEILSVDLQNTIALIINKIIK